MKKFVPDDFIIPTGFITDKIKARPLTIDDTAKDYDAVVSSIDHIKGAFGVDPSWPSPDISLEDNLKDLKYHQEEWKNRTSFAYTVMSPNESVCLGCFYIYPHDKDGYDAIVYMWVRKSEFDKGLDPLLEKEVRAFMKQWQFKRVLYSGRTEHYNPQAGEFLSPTL